MLPLFLALLVVAGLWVYIKWSNVKSYWKVRGVPFDDPHFILGSLTFLQKKNAALWMREIYENFKAPYVGIWLFWRPALVVNCPKIGQRILVKDFDVFRNRLVGTGISKGDPIGGLNIFAVNDPIWTSMRRRLTPTFTSAKLKALHGLFYQKAGEIVKRIDNDQKAGIATELRYMFTDYTTDVIGIAAFGVGSDATLTSEGPMRSVTKDFMEFSVYRGIEWGSIFFLPELASFFKFQLFPKKSVDYFRSVFKTIVAQRGGYTNVGKENDLLDFLRKVKSEAIANGEEMDEDLLIAQAAVFLQAGFDTSASALTFATYELAFRPDLQDKIYQELMETKNKLGDQELDAYTLGSLVNLTCTTKETLRKYSPLGWLDRVASADYKIDENLTIPAGTTVYVNAIGMHYDPEFYPEPEKFKPERFMTENEDSNPPPYMPFGEGPRNCVGMRFGYHSVWYGLSSIIMNYKIEPLPEAKKPNDCEIEKKGLLLIPGEPFYVNFVSRN